MSKKEEYLESEKEASDDDEIESTELNRNKLDIRPKRNQEIKYTSNGETFAGKVVKVGKPNGKDRLRCWIKKKDGETIGQVENWVESGPWNLSLQKKCFPVLLQLTTFPTCFYPPS